MMLMMLKNVSAAPACSCHAPPVMPTIPAMNEANNNTQEDGKEMECSK